MRIAVTMSYTENWSEIAAISVPNMRDYCAKNRYDFFVTVDEYDKYNGICKLNNILLLGKSTRFDYIFSFDCDTLITNHNVKLENFTNNKSSLFVCQGLNMGVFGVPNNLKALTFIEKIKERIIAGIFDCEQDAVFFNTDDVSIFDHPAFNSYLSQLYPEIPQPVTKEQGQWEPGCFVLHVPALSIEKRIEVLKEYSQYVVYE